MRYILKLLFIGCLFSCHSLPEVVHQDGYVLNTIYPDIYPSAYSGVYNEPQRKYQRITTKVLGQSWDYYIYDPRQVGDKTPIPVMMLFHGANRTGISMIDHWKEIAKKENILLIAPNAKKKYWAGSLQEIMIVNQLPKNIHKNRPIDFENIYAFGHSNGANFLLQNITSFAQNFSAIGIHAGMAKNISAYEQHVANNQNKMTVSIVIGTRDHLFPADQVRATAKMLAQKGYDVKLHEVIGHNHWYYDNALQFNRMIWNDIYHKEVAI